MNDIFTIVFHEDDTELNNEFQSAIAESPYSRSEWPGQSCYADSQDSCVSQPGEFGISILPAYVFMKAVDGNWDNAAMVKKIEGRELSKEQLMQEIEDAYKADYDVDLDNGAGGSTEQDGKSNKGGLGFLNLPIGSGSECESFLPKELCGMKLKWLLLIIMAVALFLYII